MIKVELTQTKSKAESKENQNGQLRKSKGSA
jgi:hypothetical protein